MNYSDTREITPVLPDGTPDDNDRVEIGPTRLAMAEWDAAGLEYPNLKAMREFRLSRITKLLQERDYGAILLFDPLNIRYATDTTNMQLWNSHNPFRACLVTADGYIIIWDFKGTAKLLSAYNPLIREAREGGADFFYFDQGDLTREGAGRFAQAIDAELRKHCGANRRLAVDKIMVHGLRALEAIGIEVMEGEEVTEKARVIKGPDEIKAMRCAVHACEAAMREMEDIARPGLSEDEVWAALHAGNIKRGGEWIETRLLASGPRTNPWFQECGPRIIQPGDLLAFDTDLVGCYGMCVDMSRTWLMGDGAATAEQMRLFREAHAHITENMQLLGPGVPFRDLTHGGRPLPAKCVPQRYGAKMHGVGLCDEWPLITYPEDFREGAFDYALEPGMMICVEVYLGEPAGREGIKLEDQCLITETGFERMTTYPFDARLMG